MNRLLFSLCAGALLAAGCSKSNETPPAASGSPAAVKPSSDAGQSTDLTERAKAEALREFNSAWTNNGSLWTSYTPPKKMLVQLTNMTVRVEAVELTDKQQKKGLTWAADVFFAGQSARNHTAKSGWSEWRPTTPLRFPVMVSNGVWIVENNFRKSFVLPLATE